MTPTKRRVILYASCIVAAAGLLFAGFGITIPPDPGARLSGAPILASLGDFDGAIATCDTVLKEHPDNLDARVYKATFLAQAQRFDEALSSYDEALAHTGTNADLRRRLRADRASVLIHAGRLEEFQRERDDLAKQRVDKSIHMLDGMLARKQGDTVKAEQAFRRALDEDADYNPARSLLVDVLATRGEKALAERKFPAAHAAYAAALSLDEARVDIGLKLAEVRIAMGEHEAAAQLLIKIGKKPGVVPLVFRVATARLETKDVEGALDALAGAYEVDAEVTRTLFKKSPAWEGMRDGKTLEDLVSKQNGSNETRLPDQSRGIDSKQDR